MPVHMKISVSMGSNRTLNQHLRYGEDVENAGYGVGTTHYRQLVAVMFRHVYIPFISLSCPHDQAFLWLHVRDRRAGISFSDSPSYSHSEEQELSSESCCDWWNFICLKEYEGLSWDPTDIRDSNIPSDDSLRGYEPGTRIYLIPTAWSSDLSPWLQ